MTGMRIFSVGGVPVHVNGWFLLLVLWASGAIAGGPSARGLLWVVVLTASLLVHEFGHAVVARAYRLRPSVLLHGFGGLCMHDRAERDLHDLWIIAAGPAAGLALGGVVWVTTGPLGVVPTDPFVATAVHFALYVNIGWSLVNLLPIWPLDGGQLFRLAALRLVKPARAERITHLVAIGVTIAAAAYGFGRVGTFALLLGAFLVWHNVRALRGEVRSGPYRHVNRFARELLGNAREAFDAGDWHEAARLAHQIRAESNIPDRVLDELWSLLGISTARAGRPKEAVAYLKRAKPTEAVVEEWFYCLEKTNQVDAVAALMEGDGAGALPLAKRRELHEAALRRLRA